MAESRSEEERAFDSDPIIQTAQLGIEAEAFIRSRLGCYLIDKANSEEQASTEALVECDPDDVKENTRIRNEIHVCKMFRLWLNAAISAGNIAHHELIQEEESM